MIFSSRSVYSILHYHIHNHFRYLDIIQHFVKQVICSSNNMSIEQTNVKQYTLCHISLLNVLYQLFISRSVKHSIRKKTTILILVGTFEFRCFLFDFHYIIIININMFKLISIQIYEIFLHR